jgi:glycosyltransferase involved in cell wall biosynthesis
MYARSPLKVIHVITDLGMGGAEMVLYRLISRLHPELFESEVISLTSDRPVGGLIRSSGIPVISLGFRPGQPDPRMIFNLVRIMRARKPHLVQTWMYHADLVGGLAARFARLSSVVWGIRHTVADAEALKPTTQILARLNAFLSWSVPQKIVCCAEAARRSHIRMGYSPSKMIVIPNGIDANIFHPDAIARGKLRQELGLGDNTPIVGICARFHPNKDYKTFLQAARRILLKMREVHFILWGRGIEWDNGLLEGWVKDQGLGDHVHLLGQRFDSEHVFAALDIFTLSSFTEAFPSVIGEAMACEVPCVATDAGDTSLIIGDTGRIVPKRDAESLATGILDLLYHPEERHRLGFKARQRISRCFSMEKMVQAYANLYRDIITPAGT